jgi:hypothetical protein
MIGGAGESGAVFATVLRLPRPIPPEVHVTDLVEWLETAISEREAAARNAGGARWVTGVANIVQVDPKQIADDYFAFHRQGYVASVESPAHGDHIRLNDPDTVLRRCAADRKILELWHAARESAELHADAFSVMREAVQALAEGYGYQEVAAS